jgi:hypothetical protein
MFIAPKISSRCPWSNIIATGEEENGQIPEVSATSSLLVPRFESFHDYRQVDEVSISKLKR